MADAEPEPKPPVLGSAATNGIAIVEIGPEKRRNHVHKALLSHHSLYFRRALSGPWKEAQEGVVTLHDIDAATFNLYVHWLYTQTMPTDKQMPSIIGVEDLKVDDESEQVPLMWVYVRAYVFGDRVLSLAFRDEMLERLNQDYLPGRLPYKEAAYVEVIAYAFANAASGSGLLVDLVENYALRWIDAEGGVDEEVKRACFWISVQEKLPSAFLARVMDYRYQNNVEERQNVMEWLGIEDDLTKWMGVKDILFD